MKQIIDSENIVTSINVAKHWREQYGYAGRGGVIVIFDGQVQGWVRKLCDPGHWQPDCVAVDEAGRTWSAVAGNARDGALMWIPNDTISE